MRPCAPLWQGAVQDGLRVYGLEAYRSGFLLMLGWAAAGLLLVSFTREAAPQAGLVAEAG